jgi:hypothetical protein
VICLTHTRDAERASASRAPGRRSQEGKGLPARESIKQTPHRCSRSVLLEMLRSLLVLALVAAAACVVTQKDVKLDKEGSEKKTESIVKAANDTKEPQAAGSARVSQHYPEDHVRLQHLSLQHPQHQVG